MKALQESARVIRNERITERLWWCTYESPGIAATARAGQFAHALCGDPLSYDPMLRRPLSFSRVDPARGRIAFLIDVVGRGTDWLVRQDPGTEIDLMGPLGTWFEWQPQATRALLVGGGIGLAPLLVLADAAAAAGVEATILCGARDAGGLTPTDWIPESATYRTATDDGSEGHAGVITDLVPDWWDWAQQVFVCGPTPMLQAMSNLSGSLGSRLGQRPVFASLEARMGCAMGVCYSCVVRTAHGVKRVCRDGPVFRQDTLSWEWSHD